MLFACLLIPVTCPGQENEDERLSRFKAAFIYHFIDYIRWPPETQDNFFRIGVLGDSRIVETLREISKKRKVSGRDLDIKVYDEVEQITDCHLLFIAPQYAGRFADIQNQVRTSSILTVSDSPGMAKEGVAINFALIDDRLKFEINRQSLEQARLQASAQLLKLAILVEGPDAQ